MLLYNFFRQGFLNDEIVGVLYVHDFNSYFLQLALSALLPKYVLGHQFSEQLLIYTLITGPIIRCIMYLPTTALIYIITFHLVVLDAYTNASRTSKFGF